MRIVFLGTPAWAVPSLKALLDAGVDVAGVVANPDEPSGRKRRLTAPPVKAAAQGAGLEVLQPRSARGPELQTWLTGKHPEVCVVVAYGKILPAPLLAVPPRGFVNVHFSMLPAYRGAAPVQRALADGNAHTGVSIMVLTEGMDEGPVLATAAEPIRPDDNAASLGERLSGIGARLLVETLPRYVAGEVEPQPQDHERATYAPKLTTEEARIDWNNDATRLDPFVRGMDPEPGAWTTLDGQRLKVFRLAARPDAAAGRALSPGEVHLEREFVVGCGGGAVALTEVQLAGRKRMDGADLARGLRVDPGTVLA